MNKYEDYSAFLLSTIDLAKEQQPGLFQNTIVWEDIKKILGIGWEYFISITSVIDRPEITENDYFTLSKNAWLATQTLVLGRETTMGASELVLNLHKHREIPLAIKAVGLKYKDRFERSEEKEMYLDVLMEEVAETLKQQLKQQKKKI